MTTLHMRRKNVDVMSARDKSVSRRRETDCDMNEKNENDRAAKKPEQRRTIGREAKDQEAEVTDAMKMPRLKQQVQ